jgi:hypothetical protein
LLLGLNPGGVALTFKDRKMKNKITAEEARALSISPIEIALDEAYEMIRAKAAAKGKKVALHGDFWVKQGYSETEDYKEACDILRKDGFNVEFYYNDSSYFVDMYTVVSW